TLVTLAACRPFGPLVTSNVTSSPSARDLKPSPLMAEKCTNTSSPFSCSRKPNPLLSLNHFTLPFAICLLSPDTSFLISSGTIHGLQVTLTALHGKCQAINENISLFLLSQLSA